MSILFISKIWKGRLKLTFSLSGLLATQFWFLNKAQLVPLGITEEYLHYFIGIVGAIVCYFILEPLIRILVILQWSRVLTYVIGSFLFLLILGFIYIGTKENLNGAEVLEQMANITLGIMVFGVALLIIYLIQSIITYFKQQRSKSV